MVLDTKKMKETHCWSLDSKPAHDAHNHIGALDGLQKEMLGALEYDQRKKQVNDAKLRAVAQRVEYDDFEHLVAGAHLKPVKPRSQVQKDICKAFDGFVMPKVEPTSQLPAALPTLPAAAAPPATPPVPKSSNEFVRVWRRQCKTTAQRYAYLRQIDADTLPLLFRTELDAAIFDAIVATLHVRVLASPASADADADDNLDGIDTDAAPPASGSDASWAASLIQNIARINRFDLTLEFADSVTTASLKALFDAWQTGGPLDAEDLEALRAKYDMPAA